MYHEQDRKFNDDDDQEIMLSVLRNKLCYYKIHCKASSRGAYGHDPFGSVFEEHRLDSTTTDITTALFVL